MEFFTLLFLLIFGHALADYPLQGEFLAIAKNRNTPLGKQFWMHALPAHAMIHGGFVLLITSSIWLALAEVLIHGATDFLKCEGKISLNTDQAIHIGCKIVWAIVATQILI
jgi:hypothetical protein